jgi:hypothetical protein
LKKAKKGLITQRQAAEEMAGREDQAEGVGDNTPRCLSRLRSDSGRGISGQQTRHSCRTREGANVDDRR